jgi:hypothetical protein
VARYPGIEAVLDRHGLRGCGGPAGPIEEIGFFARMHQVDPAALLRDLNNFVARREGSVPAPVVERRPAQVTQLYFIAITMSLAIAILGGFPLGILAALGGGRDVGLGFRWPAVVQGHAHLQLVGFVGLFIVGMAYHILPRFKGTALALPRLALPSIVLLAAGSVLRVVAQPWADAEPFAALLVLSGVLELSGAVVFTAIVIATMRGTPRKNYDRYLIVGASWFVAASLANLILLIEVALERTTFVPASRSAPLLEMYLLGFISVFILGVSVRVLPHFLSLRPPAVRYLTPALFIFNAGLVVLVGAGWLDAYSSWSRPQWLEAVAASALAVAAVLFVWALNLHRRSVREPTGPPPGRHELLIRTAYVWLLVAVGIELFYAARGALGDFRPDFLQDGAARHALALGFITQMIFGVGSRALPAFAGKRLYSQRLVLVVWFTLNAAVLMRVGHALFPWGGAMFRFDHIAAAGGIALLASIAFSYNIWRTLRARRRHGAARGERLAQARTDASPYDAIDASVVADILANIPGSLELLISRGFTPLKDPELRARLTPHVTLAIACSMHNIDLESLIADLRALQAGQEASGTSPATQQALAWQ